MKGDVSSQDDLDKYNLTILSTRVRQTSISDRSFWPENNYRIILLPVFSPNWFDAHNLCLKLRSKLFAPNTQDEFDFFWKRTAYSQAMENMCFAGGRRLVYLGIVKLLGENNQSMPSCPRWWWIPSVIVHPRSQYLYKTSTFRLYY